MMTPPSAVAAVLSYLVHSRLACFLTGFTTGFSLCLGSIIIAKRHKRHQVFVVEIPSPDTISMAPTLRPRPGPSHNDGDDDSVFSRNDPPPLPTSPPPPPPPTSPPRTPPRYVDADPHPTHGFRVVRCTIGLVNPQTMALDKQNIELCFHDDFVALEDRPLSLHLDRRHLSMYDIPPLLTEPPPPGAIFDLGRVDVIPDDPDLAILLERQIRREIAEEIQRQAQETQSIRQRVIHLAHVGGRLARNFVEANRSHMVLILRLLLGILMLTFVLYAYLPNTSEPTTSPVPLISLVGSITSVALATTQLTPSIFFNPFFYATITDGSSSSMDNPEQVIGKLHMLDETWDMTDHLFWKYLHKSFSAEELRKYAASDQSSIASGRFLRSDLWEYAGLRWRHIQETWARGKMLHSRAKQDWLRIATEVFLSWTLEMDMFIESTMIELEFVNVTSASSLFIAPETGSPNDTTCRGNLITRAALPKEIPREVRDILDTYRDRMARLDFLSSSCKVLQDCTAPLPHSAPGYQVLHPSCQICRADDCSPEAMIKNLEEWSVTARARNLTWRDETESDKWIAGSFSPNRMAEYFWPNKTEFPLLFDQAVTLAQLKDAMNQTAEAAELIKKANQKIQDKGILSRIKGWTNGEQVLPDPEDDIKQLKEMLQVRFWRHLRDVVQGIQAISGICGELLTLLSLVNELYSPSNWIIEEGKSTVMLQKMAHPKDQAKALNNLRRELDRRLGVLDGYYQLWAWSDGVFGEEEEEEEEQDEEHRYEEESEE